MSGLHIIKFLIPQTFPGTYLLTSPKREDQQLGVLHVTAVFVSHTFPGTHFMTSPK